MTAQLIYDHVPIGAIIAWSDGTPRPPARHRNKLSAWKSNNANGQLIRKQGMGKVGNITLPACFTLHEADYGSGGIVAIRVHQTFLLNSKLRFTVLERPTVDSVRTFDRPGNNAELVHLATSRQAAEEWLTRHGYPNAVLEEVKEAEASANAVEGRAA